MSEVNYKKYRHMWMHLLSDDVKRKSINSIILPGVTDSRFTYIDDSVSPNKIAKVSWIPCIQNRFVLDIIGSAFNIFKLLKNGVRFFDLKLSFVEGTFYIRHGVVKQTLLSVLEQFKTFLTDHISEIVVVQVSSETNFDKKIDIEIENLFKENFENILVCQKFYFPSYQEIIDANQQMLFSYKPVNSIPPNIYNWRTSFFTDLHIISDQQLKFDFSENFFNSMYISCVLTAPDFVGDIFFEKFTCFFSQSTLDTTIEKVNSFIENLDVKNASCIAFDFPQIDNISTVVGLNFKK